MRTRKPSPALARPVKPRDHAPLKTVQDACSYMLALPEPVARHNAWQHAAALAIAARDRPDTAAIAALTAQLELALFVTYRADLAPPAQPLPAKKPPAPSIQRAGRRRASG